MYYQFENMQDFLQFISQNGNNGEIYLVCAGFYGKYVGKWMCEHNIGWKGYLDNNLSLHGEYLNKKRIQSIKETKLEGELFIICSVLFYKELEVQLLTKGIQNEKIIGFNSRAIFDEMGGEIERPYKYTKRLLELKGIAKENERCFIIGNGPSLRLDDLEKIGTECSLATNHICRCFDLVKWRPRGYFINDPNWEKSTDQKYWDKIQQGCSYIFCSIMNPMFRYKDSGIKSLYFYYAQSQYNIEMFPLFSENAEQIMGRGETTVYQMLQMAVYMGYKYIYLLGMDLGFAGEQKTDGTVVVHDEENAYATFLKRKSDGLSIYATDSVLRDYRAVKKYADEHGIKIYNATRGGYLEVFERVNFDLLF